jgi:peptidoglycan hydrolase-like protein with peptidoglycan-binding domain
MVEQEKYFVETFEPPKSYLKLGSSGDNVKVLQERLNVFGAGLEVDGQFGNLTNQAVLSFQRANGLEVDGIVGPKTWKALDSYIIDDDKKTNFSDMIMNLIGVVQ